jgi:hypothetical protein
MHFDSFSLGARHLFQKLVFFCDVICTCDTYIVVFRIKISIRISKKSMCSHLNFFFDSLTLKPLDLYVNLVDHLVAYSQPFNLVHR